MRKITEEEILKLEKLIGKKIKEAKYYFDANEQRGLLKIITEDGYEIKVPANQLYIQK